MPNISRFYGILIAMYFKDHVPPHFHAYYGEYEALVSIATGDIAEGSLPARAEAIIRMDTLHTERLISFLEKQGSEYQDLLNEALTRKEELQKKLIN